MFWSTTIFCCTLVCSSHTCIRPNTAFLVSKMAEEGIFEKDDDGGDVKQKRNSSSSSRQSGDQRLIKTKKARMSDKNDSSILEQEGVNMRAVDDGGVRKDMSQIFPSYRGRGRGGKP